MQTSHVLLEEIAKLPIEQYDKVLSFVRFLSQENDKERIMLSTEKEDELIGLHDSDDFITSAEMLAKIKELP